MTEEDVQQPTFISTELSIAKVVGGPFDQESLSLSKWKFHDLLRTEMIYSNQAIVTHLMNGLIHLLYDEDKVWEATKDDTLSDTVPSRTKNSDGTIIYLHEDVGVRAYTTLAMFAIQAIARKRDITLNEKEIKRRLRALIGYSLRWVETKSMTLDVSGFYSIQLLADVISRIPKKPNPSGDSEE